MVVVGSIAEERLLAAVLAIGTGAVWIGRHGVASQKAMPLMNGNSALLQ